MPIQFHVENGGRIVGVDVSGKLVKADYAQFVPEFERLIQRRGKLRVLFDLTGFQGWDASALWEEIKFDVKHYADLERLATIGDKKWQHDLAVIFKPFMTAPNRYFDVSDADKARKWLLGASDPELGTEQSK